MIRILSLIILLVCMYSCERDMAEYEYRVFGTAGTYEIEYKDHRGNMIEEKITTPWIYSGRVYQTAHLFLKVRSYEPIVELVIGDLTVSSTMAFDSIQLINIVVAVQENW